MVWEALLAKAGIDGLIGGLKKIRGTVSKKEYRKLLTAAVSELLQTSPDINKAEANIRAAEAMGLPRHPSY
jgi:outer membrane protein TolC